jgi:hypothetical protein
MDDWISNRSMNEGKNHYIADKLAFLLRKKSASTIYLDLYNDERVIKRIKKIWDSTDNHMVSP